jgi:thioredoxin 1
MKAIEITGASFEAEVLDHSGVVLVEFWASACGHCRLFAPILEGFAQEQDGRIKVVTINIDNEGEMIRKANILATPTMMLFKDGKRVKNTTGAKKKEQLEAWVSEALAGA